ncbi:MAG: NAD(+) diphosphatase [Alphaproteobacteria bacterium]|nr:NAD(+) diphosphatase [Alphaproteobacteria bacterium]
MKAPNFYAETGLDRMAMRRGDEVWLRGLLEAADSVILPVWRARSLVLRGADAPRIVTVTIAEATALLADGAEPLFLGMRAGCAHFALDLSDCEAPDALPCLNGRGEFVDLREVGPDMPQEEGGVLAYARGLAHWHRTHRFCGRCGAATEAREAGHVRRCTDPGCGASHFPRTDPAVIMLVSSGDRVLLGRKAEWPAGRYSVLAGFVEPGETLEGAVAREVMEEAGVPVADVRYHSSQPWPFPASLMLGFFATALDDTLTVNRDELEDARWFTRRELTHEDPGYRIRPRSDSVARRLIADWLDGNET